MYTVVFDARSAGWPGWWFIPVGLVFIAIGYFNRSAPASKPRSPALSWLFRNALVIFACLWTTIAAISVVGKTLRVRYRLNHGDYVVVEGVVTSFLPGDPGGHRDELWGVRSGGEDHWYHYSSSVITPGFRVTQRAGGPIHDGVRVRIADADGLIARLEVATSDLPGRQ